jgi:hypothetical protein
VYYINLCSAKTSYQRCSAKKGRHRSRRLDVDDSGSQTWCRGSPERIGRWSLEKNSVLSMAEEKDRREALKLCRLNLAGSWGCRSVRPQISAQKLPRTVTQVIAVSSKAPGARNETKRQAERVASGGLSFRRGLEVDRKLPV